MSVPGAYQKHLRVPLGPDNEDYGTSFVFHMDKEICLDLQVELEQTISVLQVSICADCYKVHRPLLNESSLNPVPFVP